MGKLIFRIIHILALVVGVVLVTSITDANVRQRDIIEYSHVAYDDGDLSFMIDGNYYDETPLYEEIITYNQQVFNVYIYDVVYAINANEETTFNDGLQLIIEQTDGEEMPYATNITFYGTNNFELSYAGTQYYDLPLYVMYDQDNGKLRINRSELGIHTIERITVVNGNNTYIELNVDIDALDLTAKNRIESYMDSHDILNIDDIPGLVLVKFLQIDTIPTIVRNLAIYIVIATIISAAIIFYQKRHMGRGKVNPRLKEDLKRLKQNEQSDI